MLLASGYSQEKDHDDERQKDWRGSGGERERDAQRDKDRGQSN